MQTPAVGLPGLPGLPGVPIRDAEPTTPHGWAVCRLCPAEHNCKPSGVLPAPAMADSIHRTAALQLLRVWPGFDTRAAVASAIAAAAGRRATRHPTGSRSSSSAGTAEQRSKETEMKAGHVIYSHRM